MPPTALYLHSSWRSSSTYVWAKYRKHPAAYAYFEPLAEHLGIADDGIISNFIPWAKANHPPLDRPYHEEFRPLLTEGKGIANFPMADIYRHYRLDGDEDVPALEQYFQGLCDYATGLGKMPVFGLVRSALRVGWFRKHLPGVHVFIRRDPRAQFLSCLHQVGSGSTYFLERPLVIAGHNADDPLFAPLVRWLRLPRFVNDPALPNAPYIQLTRETEPATLYAAFYYIHLLGLRSQEGNCDCIIDVDALADDPATARETAQKMEALTGIAVSFDDSRPERYSDVMGGAGTMFEPVEASIRDLLAEALGSRDRLPLDGKAR